jgi:hypothetical protein
MSDWIWSHMQLTWSVTDVLHLRNEPQELCKLCPFLAILDLAIKDHEWTPLHNYCSDPHMQLLSALYDGLARLVLIIALS